MSDETWNAWRTGTKPPRDVMPIKLIIPNFPFVVVGVPYGPDSANKWIIISVLEERHDIENVLDMYWLPMTGDEVIQAGLGSRPCA